MKFADVNDTHCQPIVDAIVGGKKRVAAKLFDELTAKIKGLKSYEAHMLAMKIRKEAEAKVAA